MSKPCDLGACEARRLIGAKQLSPVELLDSCLARVEQVNPALNAVVALDADRARKAAQAAEQAVMAGEDLGILHGLPVGIKDLEATAGLRTTWGSLIYKDHVPDADDPMVANVRACGGIIIGKTNTPEFGAGGNTRNAVYGATANPFNPELTCGGSSGGAAVALASNMMPLATGSDYGGSLRTPASFCGVVGFRPSPGLVPSPNKPVALSPFGVLGPMARSVDDAYLLLRAQADIDRRDPFSSSDALDLPEQLPPIDLARLRVAMSPDLCGMAMSGANADQFAARMARVRGLFAEARDAAPDFSDVHECFEILRGVSFVAAHGERLAQHRDLLGPNVIDNTERGLAYSLADVARAHVQQSNLQRRYRAFFDDVDILLCPATAVPPFPHRDWYVSEIDGRKMETYMRWLGITYALTMAMPCVCVVPCGVDENGLPFGIQIAGPSGSDIKVLAIAAALEHQFAADPLLARPVAQMAS